MHGRLGCMSAEHCLTLACTMPRKDRWNGRTGVYVLCL